MEVFVFENGFAIQERYPIQYKDGVYIADNGYSSEYKVVNVDGSPVKDYEFFNDNKLFFVPQSLKDVDIKRISYEKPVEGYEPLVDGLKTIDVDTYNQLTESFKKKYKKVQGETVTVEYDARVDITEFHEAFDAEVYMAETEHPVRAAARSLKPYSRYDNDELRPGMQNFKMVSPSPALIVKTLETLHEQDERNKEQKRWKVKFDADPSPFRGDSSEIIVEYFKEPWDGRHKKQYLTKKNGGYYADGRHRMIPDYPDVASNLTVLADDLKAIPFDDCKNNDDILSVIEKVYDALFVNHD